MELSAALWSRLPFEDMQRVLSFLPVPNLCRYCIVCKRWNRPISTPEFGALCTQNAAKRDASFIVIRYQCICESPAGSPKPSGKTPTGCCFLDLNTRRWHTVEDDDQKYSHKLNTIIVGMDGGLVCQYSLTKREDNSIIVFNPIAKTLKELPTAPDHYTSKGYPELCVNVDRTSQSFKIFLINHNFNDAEFRNDTRTSQEDCSILLNDPLVRICDSTTNEWKSLTNPSSIQGGVNDVCSVMFQGQQYFLFGSHDGNHPLWR